MQPLLAEAKRRGWQLTQVVPDKSRIKPGDPVPTATPQTAPAADLLVVAGAGDWPVEVAGRFPRLPLTASELAYLGPQQAVGARGLRPRLQTITATSPAAADAFADHLGTGRGTITVVGSPQTDDLPERVPEPGLVLVLTSVTRRDPTGEAVPGTALLMAAAERLRTAGKRIVVGLHPREDPALWARYELSQVPSLDASARAEATIGIPGTVFPLIAAVGTPLVGCTDPALKVPDHLLTVCSSTIDDAALVVSAVDDARLPASETLRDSIGPVGGSAGRLFDVWSRAACGDGA
ncbi:hypothetical protein ACQEU6_02585 [Spirillospora sp. CA-108201]